MAIAGPGSDEGATYTVFDPNIGEYVAVGEEQVTGDGYYANLMGTGGLTGEEGENGENGGWLNSAITGGAAVISSLITAVGSGGNGNGEQSQPQTGQGEEDNTVFAGMTAQQLLLLAGVGAGAYYLANN